MSRRAVCTLALLSGTARESTALRSRNVSLDFHSSTSKPPYSQALSPPDVMVRRRPSAPKRSASAPSGELTSEGLMTSGSGALSSWSFRSVHAPSTIRLSPTVPAANRERRESLCIGGWTLISVAEVETEREVRRRRERQQIV